MVLVSFASEAEVEAKAEEKEGARIEPPPRALGRTLPNHPREKGSSCRDGNGMGDGRGGTATGLR